jgi:hypothetical protein
MLVTRSAVLVMSACGLFSAGTLTSAMMMMGVRILQRAREELRGKAVRADLEAEWPVCRRHESGGNERTRDQREKQRADEPLA